LGSMLKFIYLTALYRSVRKSNRGYLPAADRKYFFWSSLTTKIPWPSRMLGHGFDNKSQGHDRSQEIVGSHTDVSLLLAREACWAQNGYDHIDPFQS
jgi:hypothetical protein